MKNSTAHFMCTALKYTASVALQNTSMPVAISNLIMNNILVSALNYVSRKMYKCKQNMLISYKVCVSLAKYIVIKTS